MEGQDLVSQTGALRMTCHRTLTLSTVGTQEPAEGMALHAQVSLLHLWTQQAVLDHGASR